MKKKISKRKFQIAVIGSAGSEEYKKGGFNFEKINKTAFNIGKLLGENKIITINGGKTGIMEYVSKGAKSTGGITVGIVRGENRGTCNEYIDVEVVSNIGIGGDALIIPTMSDACIVIGGGVGTLKEIAGFYLLGKPIICMEGTGGRAEKIANRYIDEREIVKTVSAKDEKQAITMLKEKLGI